MDDKRVRRKQFHRLALTLQIVFSLAAILTHAVVRHLWGGPDLGSIVVTLPMACAQMAAMRIFRRRGLSRETRFEMLWPNARVPHDGPATPFTLRFPNGWRWSMLGTCGFFLAIFGLLYFVSADGGEIVPLLAAALTIVGLGGFALFSRPAMRLDDWGFRELSGRKVTWESIHSCRVVIQRDIFGDVFRVSVRARGEGERRLATFYLPGPKRPELQIFLLALHNALQPRQEPPDIAQVLSDEP